MGIVLPKEKEMPVVPAGTHLAVCYRVVDLGTQESNYKGTQKSSPKIMISWEIPEERTEDDKPFTIHKRYTLSGGKNSRLRQDLESWRGKAFSNEDFGKFDIGTLIGKGAMVGIVHEKNDDRIFANVNTIMNLPKGQKISQPENEPVYFSLNEFDQEVFDKLSDSMREQISKSPEYKAAKGRLPTMKEVQDGLAASVEASGDHY